MAFVLKYVVAGLLRYWFIHLDSWQTIANRVEIATPLNSWKRLVEGVYLYDNNINPYAGDAFHETPIMLILFHTLLKKAPALLPLIFTLLDLFTAYMLHKTAKSFTKMFKKQQDIIKKDVIEDAKPFLVTDIQLKESAEYVLSVYLFNPYSILNCVGMTTTVIQNLLLSGTLWAAVSGHTLPAIILLALATHQALYPVVLLVPVTILLAKDSAGCVKCKYIRTLLMFVFTWGFLVYFSAFIMDGSYDYLTNTYGTILTVSDLKPNIGLFWYFFIEMFDHFRLLFICTFQINVLLLYVMPLTLKFHKEPMLLATVLITLSATFRSYPCIGDVGFFISIFPMWKHLFSHMYQKFIVACIFIISSALAPVVWHLWIYSGSGNANFFFGVTLAFAIGEIFLTTDLLYAYIKREYTVKHGNKKEIDGKPARLLLK